MLCVFFRGRGVIRIQVLAFRPCGIYQLVKVFSEQGLGSEHSEQVVGLCRRFPHILIWRYVLIEAEVVGADVQLVLSTR